MSNLLDGILIGLVIGWFISVIVLDFFDVEIFNAMSILRRKVRELCGLE